MIDILDFAGFDCGEQGHQGEAVLLGVGDKRLLAFKLP